MLQPRHSYSAKVDEVPPMFALGQQTAAARRSTAGGRPRAPTAAAVGREPAFADGPYNSVLGGA